MDSKASIEGTDKSTPKRLAFSVENILDPNKFTGKQGGNITRMWNSSEPDDKMDDDQSDGHSSELHNTRKRFLSCTMLINF